jgi:hypothetical protein
LLDGRQKACNPLERSEFMTCGKVYRVDSRCTELFVRSPQFSPQ